MPQGGQGMRSWILDTTHDPSDFENIKSALVQAGHLTDDSITVECIRSALRQAGYIGKYCYY